MRAVRWTSRFAGMGARGFRRTWMASRAESVGSDRRSALAADKIGWAVLLILEDPIERLAMQAQSTRGSRLLPLNRLIISDTIERSMIFRSLE